MRATAAAFLVSLFALDTSASAQLAAAAQAAPVPGEIAAPLGERLAPEGHRVTIGETTLEFWWVRALPAGQGTPAWSGVAEGALIGALRISGGTFREIRGKTVKPGVYTLRLGLQPQNGDHLGASPYREFLLLSPAAADSDPKPLGFDGLVAISKDTIGSSHPAAFSLDPPISTHPVLSAHTTELGHEAITFQVATAGKGTLKFGVVLLGVIEP